MTLKNTGKKIINIGSTVLLPDATANVADKIANSPSVQALVKKGYLAVEAEVATEAEAPVKKRTSKKKAAEATEAVTATPAE